MLIHICLKYQMKVLKHIFLYLVFRMFNNENIDYYGLNSYTPFVT